MDEALKQILEFFKQKLSVWIALALACAVFLWLPSAAAKQLFIFDLRPKYGGYVACALIVAVCLIAVDLTGRLINANSERKRARKTKEQALKAEVNEIAKKRELEQQRISALHKLSVAEKQILCGYILKGEKTQYLSIQDGNVNGLCNAGIIYCSSQVGNLHGRGFAFNINDWAWDYLHKNEKLITEGVPTNPHGQIFLYQNPHNIMGDF